MPHLNRTVLVATIYNHYDSGRNFKYIYSFRHVSSFYEFAPNIASSK